MDYTLLGKRIRKQRVYLALTQEKLAERAGVSPSFIGHLEQGSRAASVHTLVSLCRALNVTPNFLLQDCFDELPAALDFPPGLSPHQVSTLKEMIHTMTSAMNHWNEK